MSAKCQEIGRRELKCTVSMPFRVQFSQELGKAGLRIPPRSFFSPCTKTLIMWPTPGVQGLGVHCEIKPCVVRV